MKNEVVEAKAAPVNAVLSNAERINFEIANVLADKSTGIEKALVVANAMQIIDQCLTPEIMEPIMRLQGSKLGFKTDKDIVRDENNRYVKGPGYPLDIVKNCFIEMSIAGLQPVGNQWNIIGGNAYVTKEGGAVLLDCIPYLQDFSIEHEEVTQSADKKSAVVKTKVSWTIDSEEKTKVLSHTIKSDAYATHDSLTGKADRKCRIWLYNKIKKANIADGDAGDSVIIDVTPPKPDSKKVDDEKTRKRIINHINNSKDEETLEKCYEAIGDDTDLLIMYEDKKRELSNN